MKKSMALLVMILLLAGLLQPMTFADNTATEEDQDAAETGNGEVILIDDAEALENFISSVSSEDQSGESEGFVPEDAEKAVFGKDNRVTVANPGEYPFCTIAMMYAYADCGCSWQGTGFMIGRNRMLTAAHCLVCTDHGKWAHTIDFYFGYKNPKNYYCRYNGTWRAWAGNIYKSGSGYSTADDYGCITLDANVGDVTGWIGYRYGMPDKDLLLKFVTVAGYRDGMLKYDTGWIQSLDQSFVFYDIDHVSGNSGGPVFFLDTDGDYKAVAIIIAENNIHNIAFRLSSMVINSFDIEIKNVK